MKKDQELLDVARTGNLQVVEKLLTPRSKSSTLAASLGIKVGANVNCQDQSGYTPLHHAALNGHRDVVTYMLEHAASVNISDNKGNFPLHLAAWSGNHNIVYTLLTHGPSIAKINEKNGDNETSLHCASQHGHSETVRVLLDNGADPSVRNIHDESPLDLASQYGRLDVVRLLLHYQPSLLSRFPECFSPLHLASRNGHKEVVELLLAHGADINRGGENGSALHEAALFGKSDVVKLLLSRGANPHTLDPKSRTALELVKQLDTQTSREIGQLILSRMQEGEDYEPISPVANLSLTSVCLRRFLNDTTIPESPHTETDMSKAFLEGTDRPDPEPPAKPPQVVVEDYYVDVPPKLNASFHPSPHHPRGILSGWSKASLNLRRSASARSSKSLPRLPSSRSRSPGSSIASPELPIRQHHPSSNMFPVSPTCRRRSGEASKLRRSSSSLPATSLSVMSLPTIPVKQSLRRSETVKPYLREPLKSEDDCVFLPLTPTKGVKAKRSQSMEPRLAPTQYQDLRKVNQEVVDGPRKDSKPEIFKDRESKLSVDSMNVSPSSNRPKKPVRSKLSTVSSPPPIPPKPPSMADLPKIRPPSPKNPPPDEDSDLADETDGDDEESKESEVADKIVESSTEEKQASLEKATKCEDGFNCGSRNSVNDASDLLPVGIPAHKLVDKIRGLEAPSSESGSKKDSTTSSLSSPRRSPSPAVSPPSPHSAMIEISQTLQNALSLDIKHEKTNSEKETLDVSRLEASTPSLIKKSAVDQVSIDKAITTPALPETSKLQVSALPSSTMHEVKPPLTSSMTLSVLAKTATLEKKVEVTVVTPQIKKNLPTSMQKDQVAIEANTDNERTKEQLSTMQEPREQIATTAKVPSANADTSNKPKTYISEAIVVPTRKPKPAIPNKPSLKPKPQIKPKPQLGKKPAENSSTTKQGAQVKTVSNESEDTIHDSSKCYVTGGAEIKRARILSTRSTDSGPVTTVSVDLEVPDETDPDLTPKADQELTPVVDPLTGYFQSNSARRNFEAHHAKDNTGHKFDLPPPPPVHVPAPPHHLMREKSDDATPVNEDVHFHYDVPKAVPKKVSPPTLKRIPDKHKEEDPQTESSSSIASWDDALSDRTEDFDMPVEVRKFRGLIRGASYRSRSKSRYSAITRDLSPYDDDRYVSYSDEYGGNEEDIIEPISHVNPVLLRNEVAPVKVMTRDSTTKRKESDESGVGRVALRYSSGLQQRRESRKKRSSRRSDGGDSPMSSSSAEEYERATEMDGAKLTPNAVSGSDGELSSFAKDLRTNSFYDNQNNNSSSPAKPELSTQKSSDAESVSKLPDFDEIVDTVTAVRSRSARGSKSESGSSDFSVPTKNSSPGGANAVAEDQSLDEKDEWAEIANIMSSIGGGLNKGPVYTKEFEKTFWQIMTGSDLPRRISTWLSELGLPQYEKVLSGNGFDDVDFLADNILEEQDLVDMDITDASHRRRILESAKNLPKLQTLPPADSSLAPCSVGDWLSSLHLPEYETAFHANQYNSMAQVRTMSEYEVKPLVVNRGHLKRIVASLRSADQHKSPSHKKSSRKSSTTSQAKASPPLSRSPLLETANFFKDYNTIVNSRATATLSSTASTGTSPAFQSGTVSSTASSNSSNIGFSSAYSAEERVPQNGRRPSDIPEALEPAIESESTRRISHHHQRSSSRSSHVLSHEAGVEGSRRSSSSTRRSRSHRHQSSKDSTSSKPRSRSGSSTRLHHSELSVFINNGAGKESRSKRSESQKSGSHRSKSRKSSSSSRSHHIEQKENIHMGTPIANVPDPDRAINLASGGTLNLRPPNETTKEVSVSSWRHTAEILINSCCNYQAHYLGSMLIPELKGVDSTKEACSKMKKSTDAMKKIPTITLSINYKGVKFIDFKSKHEIAEHEIQNISFTSQDSEDLTTFAYITFDVRTGHHYCHVFRVTTMDMAYEIILTLGQAFEVAYQLILKDKEMKQS